MKIRLSDHFSIKKLLRVALAPILMMVFTSLYTIVDGVCIANFCSKESFAGVNLIFPIIMIVGGIGFMFGTGGSALVSKLLGKKKEKNALQVFTMTIIFTVLIGLICSIVLALFIKPITYAMTSFSLEKVSQEMIDEAIKYGQILMLGQTLFMLQNVYQSFFMVNEKPGIGFLFILAGGLLNIILDILFIGIFKWGIIGAAFATISGYIVGGIGPTIYFSLKKNDYIHFVKTPLKLSPLLKICFNGSSEFVNNISTSIVSIFFNIQLLKYFGESGVNAYGIIMYVSFIFTAVFLGYSSAVAPIESYNYGAQNTEELKNVLRKSLLITTIISISMAVISFAFSAPFASIFAGSDKKLLEITTNGMRIYSIAFLLIGLSIYISTFFTALNNGLISAVIAFLRTLVFQIAFVFIFPLFMGPYGVFFAILGSEIMSFLFAIIFLISNKKKYNY